MNGFAFSALAIFCLLLPGFIFHFQYSRSAAASWTVSNKIDTATSRALIVAVLFCLPLHALWGTFAGLLNWVGIPLGNIDYRAVLALLAGAAPSADADEAGLAGAVLLWKLSAYLGTQCVAATLIGSWLAGFAKRSGFARRVAESGQGAFWHKKLTHLPEGETDIPELERGVVLSLTVPIAGQTMLYYGLLREYLLDDAGRLDRVVLEGAARRPLGVRGDDHVYQIPGELFVVDCRNVDTLDIDYFWLDETH